MRRTASTEGEARIAAPGLSQDERDDYFRRIESALDMESRQAPSDRRQGER